jgi:hypothetical protein
LRLHIIGTTAIAFTLLVATGARAELRHVELKTLGMD